MAVVVSDDEGEMKVKKEEKPDTQEERGDFSISSVLQPDTGCHHPMMDNDGEDAVTAAEADPGNAAEGESTV